MTFDMVERKQERYETDAEKSLKADRVGVGVSPDKFTSTLGAKFA